MSTTTTDMRATTALVGAVAPCAQWPTDFVITSADHSLASRQPMPSAYEVKTNTGFGRRPSEGST